MPFAPNADVVICVSCDKAGDINLSNKCVINTYVFICTMIGDTSNPFGEPEEIHIKLEEMKKELTD